jgi:hypothetical protein
VYVNVQRTFAYPMFKDFDAADPSAACPRRDHSNTPLQALTMLNDPAFAECARALGLRALRECRSDGAARARHIFRIGLAREPDAAERAVLARVYEDHRILYDADSQTAVELLGDEPLPSGASPSEAGAWIAVARTILNLDEFITRE